MMEYCSATQNTLIPKICNNIYESPKHTVKQNIAESKEDMLYDLYEFQTQTKQIYSNTNLNN